MDIEKYPHYFLMIIVLYVVTLLIGFGYFIAPASGFALGYSDFYLLSGLILLPLVFFAVYIKKNLSILRYLITALAIADFILVIYLMVLLA